MQRCLRLFSSKFLPNRERIMYKDRKEEFFDFWKVSGAAFLFNLVYAALIVEFGFPTPDIVYDFKRMISPDFDLYCRYGEKGEFRMELSNQIVAFKRNEEISQKSRDSQRSPESRFHGTI